RPGVDVDLMRMEIVERFQHQPKGLGHELVRRTHNFFGEDIDGEHRHGATDDHEVCSQGANLGRKKPVLQFQLVHHITYYAGKQFPANQSEEIVVSFPGLHIYLKTGIWKLRGRAASFRARVESSPQTVSPCQ